MKNRRDLLLGPPRLSLKLCPSGFCVGVCPCSTKLPCRAGGPASITTVPQGSHLSLSPVHQVITSVVFTCSSRHCCLPPQPRRLCAVAHSLYFSRTVVLTRDCVVSFLFRIFHSNWCSSLNYILSYYSPCHVHNPRT